MIVNVNQCASMFDETLHVFKFSAIANQVWKSLLFILNCLWGGGGVFGVGGVGKLKICQVYNQPLKKIYAGKLIFWILFKYPACLYVEGCTVSAFPSVCMYVSLFICPSIVFVDVYVKVYALEFLRHYISKTS